MHYFNTPVNYGVDNKKAKRKRKRKTVSKIEHVGSSLEFKFKIDESSIRPNEGNKGHELL